MNGGFTRRAMVGFTLIELISVMVLIGILAFVAMPRFWDSGFDERGFRDALRAALQHGRHVAIASRRYVCVDVTPGAGTAGFVALGLDTTVPEDAVADVSCATTLNLPSPGRGCGAGNRVCAPTGISLGGSNVIFDPLGRPVTAARTALVASVSFTVTGAAVNNVTVEAETGYIR